MRRGEMKTKMNNTHILFAALFAVATLSFGALSGCVNTGGDTSSIVRKNAASTSGTSSSSAGPTFNIYNATFEAVGPSGASGATGAPATHLNLYLNAGATATLNSVCVVQSGGGADTGKACSCRYSWSETNSSDSTTITRTADAEPDQITSFQMRCALPPAWTNSEILDNTQVRVSIIPNSAAGSTQSFATNTVLVTKTTVTSQGDFRDIEGRSYKNIYHYVCYDRAQKNQGIFRNLQNVSNGTTTNTVPVANDFVLGAGAFTGQSYYYDFYIRNSELGSPNSSANGFVCPTTNIAGVQSFYPMDTTFALALNSSKDFPVQVNSLTVVPIGTSQSIIGTIGYAAKPQSDGSCPSFADSNGQIRRTFRLRKYSAAYPLRYNADGDPLDQSQQINTLYVMDRPVNKATVDPLKPTTRVGPKPCPFSFRTAQFGQRCMSDASLTGWSIDGDQIDGNPKCPVFPPVPNEVQKTDGTVVVRPYQAFVPRYLEDTTFEGCAFQSSTPVDPEIVLSTDSTIFPAPVGPYDFWCAKHYPPADPNPLNRAPGECSLADSAAAVKTDTTYACQLSYNPINAVRKTPQAGCCQVCSGTDCSAVGGGTTPAGRNAAFSPPQDVGNPAQGIKQLSRGTPNVSASSCFDPSED